MASALNSRSQIFGFLRFCGSTGEMPIFLFCRINNSPVISENARKQKNHPPSWYPKNPTSQIVKLTSAMVCRVFLIIGPNFFNAIIIVLNEWFEEFQDWPFPAFFRSELLAGIIFYNCDSLIALWPLRFASLIQHRIARICCGPSLLNSLYLKIRCNSINKQQLLLYNLKSKQ